MTGQMDRGYGTYKIEQTTSIWRTYIYNHGTPLQNDNGMIRAHTL
jgi:hypothetical protein